MRVVKSNKRRNDPLTATKCIHVVEAHRAKLDADRKRKLGRGKEDKEKKKKRRKDQRKSSKGLITIG